MLRLNIILLLFSIISLQSYSQDKEYKEIKFVRVYDLEGNKIFKGKIFAISDTTILVETRRDAQIIPVDEIGYIKTRRTRGHNVAVGAILGGVVMGIMGAAATDPDDWFINTQGEGFAIGAFGGAFYGGAIGGISSLFKKIDTIVIGGDPNLWKEFKERVLISNFASR